MEEQRYAQWKSVVPILYDWFAYHSLVWPSLSCRWGPLVAQAKTKDVQRVYYSEQTDGSVPNTFIIATAKVVNPRVASAENILKFSEDTRSPFMRMHKTILHPGEVNRIRELPQNNKIVATHTDSPDVLIWDVETQPYRQSVAGAKPSRPDLILTGHLDNAEFALGMCPVEPFVLSGGKDKSVVLWSIRDHVSSLAVDQGAQKPQEFKDVPVGSIKPTYGSAVKARGIFRGHENTVEDVQFHPSSAEEFCSVGDDSLLMLWDARTGYSPVAKVEKAHSADIHCVDWNSNDVNLILTGSADKTVHMYDRRNLTSGNPIHKFEGHTAAVLCVQWCPTKTSVFGSSAEDCILNLWDYEKIGKQEGSSAGRGKSRHPAGLFFQHAGHKGKVVDFHWNPANPWTILSASEGGARTGGCALQLWRITDLLSRPRDQVLSELESLKSHVQECAPLSSSAINQ